MNDVVFIMASGIAVAALAGWLLTLGMLTRSLLPMANALGVCQKIVDREDAKVASLAERVLRKRNPQQPPAEARRPEQEQANPLAEIFGAGGLTPIDEQPDSNETLEVVG